MNGRHYRAQARVGHFVRLWNIAGWPERVHSLNGADLLLVDLEELMKPRQVVRTIEQLQALPAGTVILVDSDRAAQVENAELYDLDTGAEIPATRLLYVGTDLYDNLTPDPSPEELDTLRRMLPAIVIDTKED